MTAGELRASLALAAVFALRMLGLFLVLPVFSLSATHYQGGSDPVLVGFAMGVYGLTQAILQWPFGLASDRYETMECLQDMLWQGQVNQRAPDGAAYVEAVQRRATRGR